MARMPALVLVASLGQGAEGHRDRRQRGAIS